MSIRYCTECGDKLEEVQVPSSREEIADCTYCNLRHHTNFGEYGESSVIRIYHFTPETRASKLVKVLEELLNFRHISGKRLPKLVTLTDDECKDIIELLGGIN